MKKPTTYKIRNKVTGETFVIKEKTVGGMFGKVPMKEYQEGQRNIIGNIFERPAAMAREAIRERPYLAPLGPVAGLVPGGKRSIKAAIDPSLSPTFQKQALEKYYAGKKPSLLRTLGGFGVSAAGLGADILSDPVAVLAMLAGKIPTGGGVALGSRVAATRPAQAIGKFISRPRYITTGQGFPTGSVFKRRWVKFKNQPASAVKRIEKAIIGTKEIAVKGQRVATKEATKALQADKAYTANLLEQTDDVFKQNTRMMKIELQKTAEKGSLEIQPKLQEFIRNHSKSFGEKQDIISKALAKKGESLTKGEINNFLVKTMETGIKEELPIGRAHNVIKQLIETKYGTTQFSKRFTFTEIVNDVRRVRGVLASEVKAGRKGFAPDEVIIMILNKNWGDVIASRVPEFAKLNKSYAPIIQAVKKSHKIFKPYAGSLETKAGTDFLKKVGTNKAEAGELRFLSRIAKRSEFAPGVGKIGQPIKAVGRQIRRIETQHPLALRAIKKEALVRQTGIQRRLTVRETEIAQNLKGWLDKLSGLEKKAVLNQWIRRGAMTAGGGTLLLYLIKRRAAKTLLNALSSGEDSGQAGVGTGQF